MTVKTVIKATFTLYRIAFRGARKAIGYRMKSNGPGGYKLLGSFSIDDGDGSENVTLKRHSGFFQHCRVYSNPLKMSNVREFHQRWFLGDRTQV